MTACGLCGGSGLVAGTECARCRGNGREPGDHPAPLELGATPAAERFGDAVERAVRAERRRVERALRGAIMAGYDGVDFNREPLGTGPAEVVPWDRPAPDGDNGSMTERYEWRWFSDETLAAVCRGDLEGVFER